MKVKKIICLLFGHHARKVFLQGNIGLPMEYCTRCGKTLSQIIPPPIGLARCNACETFGPAGEKHQKCPSPKASQIISQEKPSNPRETTMSAPAPSKVLFCSHCGSQMLESMHGAEENMQYVYDTKVPAGCPYNRKTGKRQYCLKYVCPNWTKPHLWEFSLHDNYFLDEIIEI